MPSHIGLLERSTLHSVMLACEMKKPWRRAGAPDLAQLSRLVTDLEQCHGYFETENTARRPSLKPFHADVRCVLERFSHEKLGPLHKKEVDVEGEVLAMRTGSL